MFRFQRRINRLAASHRAKLEKYLGDGAFYSSREATNLLLCSIQLQRYYVAAVREGLSFDRGLRIALNFGPYRLIPMSSRPEEGERYEFFGAGLVELSRLTTGKATQEIDEVKTMLINQGYPEATVHRFFSPLSSKNLDVVDKKEESRPFYAYINRNGTLHNNGMVATGPFIAQLDHETAGIRLFRGQEGGPHLRGGDLRGRRRAAAGGHPQARHGPPQGAGEAPRLRDRGRRRDRRGGSRRDPRRAPPRRPRPRGRQLPGEHRDLAAVRSWS